MVYPGRRRLQRGERDQRGCALRVGTRRVLASKDKTTSEIQQRMQSTATDLGASGNDPNFGYGRINANRAVP